MHRKIYQLVALATLAVSATAQSTGTFTPAGNMTTARLEHTATLLADGRVLIAGGCASTTWFTCRVADAASATAELYHPATGTFTATGRMTTVRFRHTATMLADGRVLITGGGLGAPNDPIASAELYDPSNGTFVAIGNMTRPRTGHAATLLADGRVLIAGGCDCSAEIYDPGTGVFNVTGDGAGPWFFAPATLLPDGRVLFAWFETSSLYDPRAGTFSLALTGHGLYTAASLLMNGTVLLAGGNSDPGPSADALLYDPSTGVFRATGSMTATRGNTPLTLLPDGKTLIAGGLTTLEFVNYSYDFCCVGTSELYDPAAGTFTATGNMITARDHHTATLLRDGQVLIAGGTGDNNFGILATAELYNPAAPRAAPELFSLSGNGRGQGAVWHADTGQIASPENPAITGEILSMCTTSLADGGVIPPQVAIGGRTSEILFFGKASEFPGYNQVYFRVPDGVTPGPAVQVRLTYIGRPSNAVTIGVQ